MSDTQDFFFKKMKYIFRCPKHPKYKFLNMFGILETRENLNGSQYVCAYKIFKHLCAKKKKRSTPR